MDVVLALSIEKMALLFPTSYLMVTKFVPHAVMPWRLMPDSPYYVLSAADEVVFQPLQTKSVGTGLLLHIPDGIYARVTAIARPCLSQSDDGEDEFYPLRLSPMAIMRSDYQSELCLTLRNLSPVESYTVRPGQSLAVVELRPVWTPTIVQVPQPQIARPPPATTESRTRSSAGEFDQEDGAART